MANILWFIRVKTKWWLSCLTSKRDFIDASAAGVLLYVKVKGTHEVALNLTVTDFVLDGRGNGDRLQDLATGHRVAALNIKGVNLS
jgi:hypothetical protein